MSIASTLMIEQVVARSEDPGKYGKNGFHLLL